MDIDKEIRASIGKQKRKITAAAKKADARIDQLALDATLRHESKYGPNGWPLILEAPADPKLVRDLERP